MRWHRPLLGIDPRLTALGLGYCGLLVGAILLTAVLAAGAIEWFPAVVIRPVDGLTGLVLVAVLASTTALPLVYALVNGGPILAATIAMAPIATSWVITRTPVLTNDVVMALIAAATGAAVAVSVTWTRAGRHREMVVSEADLDGLLVASALSLIALVASLTFLTGAPQSMVSTLGFLPWFLAIPVGLCLVGWCLVAYVRFTTDLAVPSD